ncbi:sulfatase [Desertivirga arenae]|uniref:sulfatase n=1 Tax=Desertivirga arenae TaxID=2810309 RepID=UPI001A97AE67|nr:sulfatase [Pedobacter sp. SYSU D00823]
MKKLSNIFTTVLLAAAVSAGAQIKKPNIVFIMADDLGWGELNTYASSFNETPNLNKLAAQGTRFIQAYAAAPNCSPTRASIMTGQYPARVGITDFLPGGQATQKWLDPAKYVTLNEALSEAGYHTGIVGKWHLDTHFANLKGGPKQHGFDEVIGSETKYIADGDYFFPYDKIATFDTGAEGEYLTDRQSKEAAAFIKRNKANPFFLYLTYYSVHSKLDAPEDLVNKYKKKFDAKYGDGQAEKIFGKGPGSPHRDNPYLAAMLERIDAGVGEIMETLEKSGLAENTLLVFFSDNGGAGKGANNGKFREGKMWLYEGGIREPLLIRWPGKVKAGAVEDTPVSSVDFYPTFLSIAGAAPSKQLCDGLDISPLFKGKVLKRDELYWHYPAETAKTPEKMASVVRKGDYKLLEFYADNRLELYNLKDDPSESRNLTEIFPKKTAKLKKLLDAWKINVNAEKPNL